MDGYIEYATVSVEYAFVSEDKPAITTIEEALIGTWSTASGDTIVITETTITVNGTEVTNLVIEENSWTPGYMVYVFNVGADEFQIYWGDEDYDDTIDTPYYGSTSSWEADAMTPYTGEEPEDPELDAFAGTYTYNDFTLTFDGQGNGVYNNGSDWAFTYTVYADVASISDFAAYDDGENRATLTETGVDVHFSGNFGDDLFNASFTKQAASEEPEVPATMPESFIGTWSGTKDLVEYKVVVTVDTIVLSIDSTDYTVTEFEIDAEYGDVLFSANNMNLALSAGYEEGQIFLIEMDSFSLYVTLTVASQEPDVPEEPATIPTSYVGTWGATKNEVEYKAVITETSIVLSIGGTEYTVTEFTIEEGGDVLFSANDMNLAFSDDYGADTVVLIETDNYSIYVSMTPVSEEEPEVPEDPELDAFAGSWTKENDPDLNDNTYQWTLTFDGQGNVSIYSAKYDTTYTAEYTVNDNVATFYANWADWTCTLNQDGTLQVIDMDSDGGCTVNCAMSKVVSGGEEEPEEPALDAFAGTYTYSSFTLTFDGAGNGVYNNGSDWNFTYTVVGDRANISDFAAYDDGENNATLTETGVDVHFSGDFGYDVFNASFTKQA